MPTSRRSTSRSSTATPRRVTPHFTTTPPSRFRETSRRCSTCCSSTSQRPLQVITVDEPPMSIVVGVNTAPVAGREGEKLTARQIQARLQAELVGNVSLRVLDAGRPDAWEVQGRGELQLAVLVEMMRRE